MRTTRSNSKKEAFYSVAKGRRIGIYKTWAEAESLVKGFAGAKYKKFASLYEARSFLGSGYENEAVSEINPQAETNDRADGKKRATAVSSSVTGETFRNNFADSSSSSCAASSSISEVKGVNASHIRQANEEKNSPLNLAILPEELRGETLQFLQDDCLLLCMTNSNLYQVHSFNPNKIHSWFTSDYIFGGNCNYFSKVDPILVSLRHLYKRASVEAVSFSDIFADNPLLNCPAMQSIDWSIVCDIEASQKTQGVGDRDTWKCQLKYRLNVHRTLDYLEGKVNRVTSLIKSGQIKCMVKSESKCSLPLEQLFPFVPEPLYSRLLERVSSSSI